MRGRWTTLVERLRLWESDAHPHGQLHREAADEIIRLDNECERAWRAYRIAHNQAMENGQAQRASQSIPNEDRRG